MGKRLVPNTHTVSSIADIRYQGHASVGLLIIIRTSSYQNICTYLLLRSLLFIYFIIIYTLYTYLIIYSTYPFII